MKDDQRKGEEKGAQERRDAPGGRDSAPTAGTAPGSAEKAGGAGTVHAAPAAGSETAVPRAVYEEALHKAEERDLFKSELLRERADFSNYQKRILRDRPQVEAMAVRRFVYDLLPVLDNFERALAHGGSGGEFRKGIEIVKDMLLEAMAKHGIEPIDPLGKVFDPNLHEALAHEESMKYPPDSISEVVQKGYLQNGTVIRAAKVKVARAPVDATAPPAGTDG
jgi:molecular chaperone GrpE